MPQTAPENQLTKRTLVALSHAIEQAALAGAEDGPMVVLALFQRMPYFDRERAVYDRISRLAAATVVAVVAEQAPELPDGIDLVLLDAEEDLAREWSVVVLTPRYGAVLVARDREEVLAGAATLEAGRTFDARWSNRRDEALHEALRLRTALGDRLRPSVRADIDRVLERVREIPATPGEARGDAALRLLVEQTERDHGRLRAARERSAAASRSSGGDALSTEQDLRRWSGAAGVTASGVLAVAMFAVRIDHQRSTVQDVGRTNARRDEAAIAVLTASLRPADRLTRLDQNDYLLVSPGMTFDDAVSRAYKFGADFSAANDRNAFLAVTVSVATTVTRQRPLPVEQLRGALRWAVEQGVPVATIDV